MEWLLKHCCERKQCVDSINVEKFRNYLKNTVRAKMINVQINLLKLFNTKLFQYWRRMLKLYGEKKTRIQTEFYVPLKMYRQMRRKRISYYIMTEETLIFALCTLAQGTFHSMVKCFIGGNNFKPNLTLSHVLLHQFTSVFVVLFGPHEINFHTHISNGVYIPSTYEFANKLNRKKLQQKNKTPTKSETTTITFALLGCERI